MVASSDKQKSRIQVTFFFTFAYDTYSYRNEKMTNISVFEVVRTKHIELIIIRTNRVTRNEVPE